VLNDMGEDDAFTYHFTRFDGRLWAVLRQGRADSAVARRVQFDETAKRFRHDHLVTILASGKGEGGVPYILEEYVLGVSLGEMLEEGVRVPFAVALTMIRGMALGLQRVLDVTALGGNHGPFTFEPSQGVVAFEGRARVVDPLRYQRYSSALSQEASRYSAPEIRDRTEASQAAPVYSLARVLWELCTGRPAED
jgi:hypothetical protein